MRPAVADLLDELAIKYLFNLPPEEYEDEVNLCYAFQVAHWEYLDAPETEHLAAKLSFSSFLLCILDRHPELRKIVNLFKKMNWQIPVYGAILINEACDKVLLVQTLVSNEKGGAWMFPRGKMEKRDHGASFDCACREVWEETGFQMRGIAMDDEAHYVERRIEGGHETKVVGLYLVPGVDERYAFCSQTQGEVFQFAWFRIQDLMNAMKLAKPIMIGGQVAKFVHVYPFLNSLQQFVNRLVKQQRVGHGGGRLPGGKQGHPAAPHVSDVLTGLGASPQKQQQQGAKQRRKAAASFEQAQAQAQQLALEATKAANDARAKMAAEADRLGLHRETSGSLNARRDGRNTRHRNRGGGGGAANSHGENAAEGLAQGLESGKDANRKCSMGRAEGAGFRGAGKDPGELSGHWEPLQLTLPEIKWRGMQASQGTVRTGFAVLTQSPVQGIPNCWRDFSLKKTVVLAAVNAALA